MSALPAFRYPGNVRGTFGQKSNKQPGRTDKLPLPIHPALYPKMSERETEQYEAAQRKTRGRIERLIDQACDAWEQGRYEFDPRMDRKEIAQCYALLENLKVPDEDNCAFFKENDLVFRRTGDIVAGPAGYVVFDFEPDAEISTLAPQIEVRRKTPVREFLFE